MNILSFLSYIHSAVYGVPTLILIFSVFLILNFRTRFIGVRRIISAIRAVFEVKKEENGKSPLSSALVSLSATVGTGNIVGVAGAVTLGGPGAVFWMWISALLAMTVKFCEIYLSSCYKKSGSVFGYIAAAMKSRNIITLFSAFGIIAAFGIGNLTQTNAAANAVSQFAVPLGIKPLYIHIVIGLIFSALSFMILKKESSSVKFCERILPLMAALYIIYCISAIFIRRTQIPAVFAQIFKGAVCPRAVTGGVIGSFFSAVKYGVSRGIFSNEAGIATAALAYEKNSAEPKTAALFGVFEVFVDTIIICTLTALVILSSGSAVYGKDFGSYTTLNAFAGIFGEKSVFPFCLIICFFAFSSVIGWGFYAARFSRGLKISPQITLVIYCLGCVAGAIFEAQSVWQIAEISSIFMMTVNCSSLLAHRKMLSYKKLG